MALNYTDNMKRINPECEIDMIKELKQYHVTCYNEIHLHIMHLKLQLYNRFDTKVQMVK